MVKRNKLSKNKKFRKERKGLHFGDISLQTFSKELEEIGLPKTEYENVKLNICTSMAAALWLAQIRLSLTNLPPQQVEQVPSYKFIKRGNINSSNSPVIVSAATIAALTTLVYADEISDEDDLTNYIREIIDSYTSNSKYFEKHSSSNYMLWNYGFISRHVGLFNSCPATNLKVFNFPITCKDWRLKDLLENLGGIANDITEIEILNMLSKNTFVDEGGFPRQELSFDEESISIALEKDILEFNKNISFTRIGNNAETSLVGKDETELIKNYLSPIEKVKFEQAKKLGMINVVKNLVTKAQKLKDYSEKEESQE